MWAHVLLILGFLAYLPYSKHLHIITAVVNVFFGRTRARGRLEPLRVRRPGRARGRDPARLRHAHRHDLEADGGHRLLHRVRPLPGRLPRLRDRQGAVAQAADHGPPRPPARAGPEAAGRRRRRPMPVPLVPNAVTDDVVWDCVTCGACVHECPVSIEHIDHIVDLRRHLVMAEARFPAEAEPMLRDVERSSNPWGKAQQERADWARRAGREGAASRAIRRPRCCTGSAAPPRSTSAPGRRAVSTAKLLQAAGRRLRDPGPARVVHRRPGPPDGQRVRVPGLRRAERRDAERVRA